MRHEAARQQPEEAPAEEKPKFDIDREAAAAQEAEVSAPPSRFALDVGEYRLIGDQLAKKEKEKLHVNEASEALGRGSHAAEALAESIDSDITDLTHKREWLLAQYPDKGKGFIEDMAAIDKLKMDLAKKQGKLSDLDNAASHANYPGGERGAKAEMDFLRGGIQKLERDIEAVYQKHAGQEKPQAELPPPLPGSPERPIEVTEDMIVAEEPIILLTPEMRKRTAAAAERNQGVSKDNSDAELLVYDAFRDMKPVSGQEMDAAVKANKLSPERQADLAKAVTFLEQRMFEVQEGLERATQVKKADGSVETKMVNEPGVKELAKEAKDKYGIADLQERLLANTTSGIGRFAFGLKKLFNPGLRRLVNDYDAKTTVASKLTAEIDSIKDMAKNPRAHEARLQSINTRLHALRQRMKQPPPVVNVKVR